MSKKAAYQSVESVLTQAISNWPTLYRSRLSALDNVFSNTYGVDWSNGSPVGLDSLTCRDDKLDEPLDESAVTKEDVSSRNSKLLNLRMDRQTALFHRVNAALIAMAEYGDFHNFTHTPSGFSERDLNRLEPEQMSEEWRAAYLEYLRAITTYSEEKLRHRLALRGINAESIENEVARLTASKRAAQEGLTRLGLTGKEAENARMAAIQALRYEAERFGFSLTKIDNKGF